MGLWERLGFGKAAAGPSVAELVAQGAIVIDVRAQNEWDAGHLPMAKLLPVDQLEARVADVVAWAGGNKAAAIVVHCKSGMRSARAKGTLERAGFTHVVNAGGYDGLRALLKT